MNNINDLLEVMKTLRDPNHGCPWDVKQTYSTIAPHTLEETYEVLDAIERDDMENLKEELGDLLFNIVFYAQMAQEQGLFNFEDIVQGIVHKMKTRHPHVFEASSENQLSESELRDQWQEIKSKEKSQSAPVRFGAKTTSLSATHRAEALQTEAAKFGFDWPHIDYVLDKLEEETRELKLALKSGNSDDITDELGDLLFVCVNIGRHAKVDSEMALRGTNRKFINRFEYVAERMKTAGIEMNSQQLDLMETYWQESKSSIG